MQIRDVAYEILRENGMTTVFGNPGSNELPFLAGMPEGFRYVLGLHEGAVVGMADGYSQVTGRPVLVNLHAASGSGNAMGALTNAVYARSPLVLTAGQQVRPAIGMEAMLSNVEASALTKPLVGWAGEPSCAGDVPRSLSQAIHEADLRRRPTYLSIPYDDWTEEAGVNAQASIGRRVIRSALPDPARIAELVEDVRAARNPALVLGGDVDTQGLFDDVVRLAEILDAPTWAAPSLHRLPFPNRHPLFRGVLPAGITPIADALADHDLVLVLGAPVFRYHEYLPGPYLHEGTRVLQITDDGEAAARAPFGESLVVDPGAVVRELVKAFADDADRLPQAFTLPGDPQQGSAGRVHPEQVFAALRDTQPTDTAYVVESTSTNGSWWRQMDLRRGGSYFFPASGGLGFGIPAAVGVALASPDRPVVGVIGDGSANYGITGLWTAAEHRLPVTYVLLRNGTYGALQWFAGLLGASDAPGTTIPGLDFTKIAEGYGVESFQAGSPEHLRALLAEVPDGPRLIQVDTVTTTPA
ncbi:benzoylformate decarboxylase [Tomitella gaofuii]|uniref:benzoylformate decarboxylase n=1 Tax=Tomitella gaofuii TaxID=2760083 RepID=UPI0015F805B1|nr:benzoylformate decarboxylase [Tomitella gaofuii]